MHRRLKLMENELQDIIDRLFYHWQSSEIGSFKEGEMDIAELRMREAALDRRDNVSLRIHRAISWLARAEEEPDDPDVAFILLWIAFNACYADESANGRWKSGERDSYERFFGQVLELDAKGEIAEVVLNRFKGSIEGFLRNKYVFQPFWDHINGRETCSRSWDGQMHIARQKADRAMRRGDARVILSELFRRLYVLRNQLVHGGATWNGQVNRKQVSEGREILGFLVPRFIALMIEHPDEYWGEPFYPVV